MKDDVSSKMLRTLPADIIKLCESVHEITCVADRLLRTGKIAVDDSRDLFWEVLRLAQKFESGFTPEDGDYLEEIEDFAESALQEELALGKRDPNTTPIGEKDYFFDNPKDKLIEGVYYNPDANAGGQFVEYYLPYSLILQAFKDCDSSAAFFDQLNDECTQELSDLGTDYYESCLKRYADPHPLCIGQTEETMKILVRTAIQ